MATRRRFLSLLGVGAASAPLAAKAALDSSIGSQIGMFAGVQGLGDSSLRLPSGTAGLSEPSQGPYISYEKRLIGAADYIKMFGLPEVVDFEIRDRVKYCNSLDPDIACKKTWSMAVKLMTQRERNYQRELERVRVSGWQQRKKNVLKDILGFEWPF